MIERICVSTVTQTSATMVSHTSVKPATAATEGKHVLLYIIISLNLKLEGIQNMLHAMANCFCQIITLRVNFIG